MLPEKKNCIHTKDQNYNYIELFSSNMEAKDSEVGFKILRILELFS